MKLSLVVQALLGSASAIKMLRDPLSADSNPLLVHQKPVYKDFPVNYAVPDFGVDADIRSSEANLKSSETKLKHQLSLAGYAGKETPRDYFVPDFGQDTDITGT